MAKTTYNEKKKELTTDEGKVYPGAKEGWTPPEPIANVAVNPDKTITTTIGGVTKNLNKAEFEGMGKGEKATATQDLRKAQEQQALINAGDIEGLRKLGQRENLKGYVAEQRAAGRNINDISQDLMSGELKGDAAQKLILEELKTAPEKELEGMGKIDRAVSEISEIPGRNIGRLTSVPGVKPALHFAANMIASASSILPSDWQIGTKKTAAVTQAESTFSDANKLLSEDIELIKAGVPIDTNKVMADIDAAINSISRLEEQTHGLGLANVRYWIDYGAELEASIASEKATLENQRLDLIQAVNNQRQMEIKSVYGI